MTGDPHVARLNRSLQARGEDIVLRRLVGTGQGNIDVTCRAFVRGYAPAELTGQVAQGDSRVIISPTEIERERWPGGQVVAPGNENLDRRVPRRGDKVVIQGKVRSVEAAAPIYVAGALVRIELQVRG